MNWILFTLIFYLIVFLKRVVKPYLMAGRPKAKFKAYRVGSRIYVPKFPVISKHERVVALRGIPYHWYNKKFIRQGGVLIDDHIWDIVEIETSRLKNSFLYETYNEVQFNALLREMSNRKHY